MLHDNGPFLRLQQLLYPTEYTILPIVELPIVLYVPTHAACCSCAGVLTEDMVASSTRGFCVWGVLGPFERTLYIIEGGCQQYSRWMCRQGEGGGTGKDKRPDDPHRW